MIVGRLDVFVIPSCVPHVGLKGIPRDAFLELGNGEEYLSRGYFPDVSIDTAGLPVKIGVTVTNLMHEVDLVLGIEFLRLVNPVVDWGGARLYVPNAVQTTLLQGDWLAGHVQSGTITVLSEEEELKCMRDSRIQIAVLKCPKFWREKRDSQNLRANSFKGREKFELQWGYL